MARWLSLGALVVLLTGWDSVSESTREVLVAIALVLSLLLVVDVAATTAIALAGRRGQRRRRNDQPANRRRTPVGGRSR